jgi:predicted nicotinamide N-methyase
MSPRADDFVRTNTRIRTAPLIPEIPLHLASEVVPLWQMTEEELSRANVAPPYWAFAWAGGQAVSRFILDHPDYVAGRHVLDFATGSGIGAIAAALAGAKTVLASDIDTFALTSAAMNAALNGVQIDFTSDDLIGRLDLGVDVVLAGDICYEQPMAGRVEAWLKALAAQGVLVLMGDPGRSYKPKSGLTELQRYRVATSRELEDSDVRSTAVLVVDANQSPDSPDLNG